jgi:hypothetical protein
VAITKAVRETEASPPANSTAAAANAMSAGKRPTPEKPAARLVMTGRQSSFCVSILTAKPHKRLRKHA